MSAIKTLKYTIVIFFVCFLNLLASSGYGDSLHEINTGRQNSASWQFTHELSQLWQLKYQEKESFFSPRYVEDLKQRFVNLDKQDCKLVIAPLKSVTEMPITDLQIKIVVVLWEVYLAPVDLSKQNQDVSFGNYQNWYLPENSYIIPTYINQLIEQVKDNSADIEPEIFEFGKRVSNFYTVKDASSEISTGNTNEMDLGQQSFFDPLDLAENSNSISDDESANHGSTADLQTSDGFQQNAFSIEEISRADIGEELLNLEPGIFFYEMIGKNKALLNALGNQYSLVGLEDSLLRNILKTNTLLERFSFSRSSIKTAGITYALFVHETEDIEFVKELLELIVEPPKSNFPKSYLFSNLGLKETKEISPLFLHDVVIEYFNIY